MTFAHNRVGWTIALLVVAAILIAGIPPAFSHCDTEDGPIIPAVRAALDDGNITPILKWIKADDEPEITRLFAQVRLVRAQSPEARAVADQHFIETFIRLHRAGEGAPFTGIQPAGTVDPVYHDLDQALVTGDVAPLADKVAAEVREHIIAKFNHAAELAKNRDQTIEAGRAYVEAYVTYMHFVEGLHTYMAGASSEHHSAAPETNHGH